MLKRIDEECVLGLFNASLNLEHAPSNKVRRASSELNACGQEGADSLGC